MEKFINYILQFGNLNEQQIAFIISKAKMLGLHKEDYFSEAGKIPRQVDGRGRKLFGGRCAGNV
jgi:hypothetical protein